MGDLEAPLLEDRENAYEYALFDDRIMDALRALDHATSDSAEEEPPHEHVEDEDVYKMRELIHEKPRDVIQYLEEEGVVKVAEFEVQVCSGAA